MQYLIIKWQINEIRLIQERTTVESKRRQHDAYVTTENVNVPMYKYGPMASCAHCGSNVTQIYVKI